MRATLGGIRVHPQSYEWIDGRDVAAVTRLLLDDEMVGEQKLDGMRCLIRIESDEEGCEIRFMSHGGRELVQSAAAQHFPRLRHALHVSTTSPTEMVLDGELMTDTGELWLFDMPFVAARGPAGSVDVVVGEDTPLAERRETLEAAMHLFGPLVRLVPQVVGRAAKTDLLEAVIATATEGMVFKDRRAKYDWSGGRVKTVLKLKVKRTVDCVVTARNVGEAENVRGEMKPLNNAHLAVWSADRSEGLVPIGSCTMNGKPDAPVGSVVEVEYLSWKPGGNLVQPNLLRIRDDKWGTDCLITQLVPSNKQILEIPS